MSSRKSSSNNIKSHSRRRDLAAEADEAFSSPTELPAKKRFPTKSKSTRGAGGESSSSSSSARRSRRSPSAINSADTAELFEQMSSVNSVRIKKKKKNKSSIRKDGDDEYPDVNQVRSDDTYPVEEFMRGVNAAAISLMRSLSPGQEADDEEEDGGGEDGEMMWDFASSKNYGDPSVSSTARTPLELHRNDNAFHVLANLLVEFLQAKLSQDGRTVVLQPEDRVRMERVLPESVRLDFIDAVRHRLRRIRNRHASSTTTWPLQHSLSNLELVTLQCQELGLDRDGRQNPILVAANLQDEPSFIPVQSHLMAPSSSSLRTSTTRTFSQPRPDDTEEEEGSTTIGSPTFGSRTFGSRTLTSHATVTSAEEEEEGATDSSRKSDEHDDGRDSRKTDHHDRSTVRPERNLSPASSRKKQLRQPAPPSKKEPASIAEEGEETDHGSKSKSRSVHDSDSDNQYELVKLAKVPVVPSTDVVRGDTVSSPRSLKSQSTARSSKEKLLKSPNADSVGGLSALGVEATESQYLQNLSNDGVTDDDGSAMSPRNRALAERLRKHRGSGKNADDINGPSSPPGKINAFDTGLSPRSSTLSPRELADKQREVEEWFHKREQQKNNKRPSDASNLASPSSKKQETEDQRVLSPARSDMFLGAFPFSGSAASQGGPPPTEVVYLGDGTLASQQPQSQPAEGQTAWWKQVSPTNSKLNPVPHQVDSLAGPQSPSGGLFTINPFAALAAAANPFAVGGEEVTSPCGDHALIEELERQKQDITLKAQATLEDDVSVIDQEKESSMPPNNAEPEVLAKQQLMAEIREASKLLEGSETPETARFWQDHVAELQNRLKVLNGEETDQSIEDTEAIRECNRKLISEIEHREKFLPEPSSSSSDNEMKPLNSPQSTTAPSVRSPGQPPSYVNFGCNSPTAAAVGAGGDTYVPPNLQGMGSGVMPQHSQQDLEELPLVDVVAPADLPGGYHFEAELEGKRFLATVPQGGVQQGETFSCYMRELDSVAIDIPVGYWKDSIANLCDYGCCHPVVWNAFFCPLGKVISELCIVNYLSSKIFEINI